MISISESPKKAGLLYVGTDNGHLQVSIDAGKEWTDLTMKLPERKWIAKVLASKYQEGTVYLSQQGRYDDDFAVYLYKSTDYGKTWKSIAGNLPAGPMNMIQEDPVNPNVLYTCNDFGVYVSTNGGQKLGGARREPAVGQRHGLRHPSARSRARRGHARARRVGVRREQVPDEVADVSRAVLWYRHTQIGWPRLAGVVPTCVVGVLMAVWDLPLAWLVVGIAPIVLLLMGWLTVSVDDTAVVAQFGVGLIRKRIPLADIRSFEAVRNPWYYGWGVRLIPGGWLYNVAGVSAVDFTTRDGRHVRIGTPEPEALSSAVAARVPPGAVTAPGDVGRRGVVRVGVRAASDHRDGRGDCRRSRALDRRAPDRGVRRSVRVRRQRRRLFDARPAGPDPRRSLVDELPAIERKVNGFAAGGKLRGKFTVAGIGPSEVFVDRDVPPFVVVKTTNGVVIVNGVNADATRRLCDDLARAAGR